METERLVIDRLRETDKPDYFRCISHDREVLRTFVCRYTETPEELDISAYVANDAMFAIRLKKTGRLIGLILYFGVQDSSCEIGYGIGSGYWGQGYVTEAVERFLEYLFLEEGFENVCASFFTGNEASKRVMEKCGMAFSRFSAKEMEYLGEWRDLTYYAVSRKQWEEHRSSGRAERMMLVEPTMAYDAQIQAYRREFLSTEGSMDGCGSLRRFDETQDWIDQVESLKREETTPPGLVPSTQYIYVRESDGKIVGVIQIRRRFNEFLEKYGGHIGYSVCPSERRKGYATQMLRRVLPVCRALGIERVLISCLEGNEGSRRTILNNGGVYESTVYCAERDIRLERYWIDLSDRKGDNK